MSGYRATVSQMSLFDVPSVEEVDTDDVVLVYSCAMSGRTSTPRMFMRADEAVAFCSSPLTAGRGNWDSVWMTMWTSIGNLRRALGDKPRLKVVDDGRFAGLLDELEIVPIPLDDPRIVPLLTERRELRSTTNGDPT